mmetsp:Transcript_18136/g.70105  ORF Transcript_18136/g.70105 Transcript_18136/m.70105 type:complete len:106 (-) Transcript_18136:685-1002(-)
MPQRFPSAACTCEKHSFGTDLQMFAAVDTQDRCVAVLKKSRKASTAIRPPLFKIAVECSADNLYKACRLCSATSMYSMESILEQNTSTAPCCTMIAPERGKASTM